MLNRKPRITLALMDIGGQISNYRKRANITQIRLSKLAHVPQSSIARIENGKNTSLLTLAKIAIVMNKNIKLKVI